MEVKGEYRRVTRQATRKITEPIASPKKEEPVLPEPINAEPNPKRKRRKNSRSPSARPSRKSRSISSKLKNESTEGKVESDSGELQQQSSWSSSISDDEELPSAVLHSPMKSSTKKTYKKNDIVWIKYRTDEYRPCLITSVEKDHVKYKFVNETRKYTWRAKFDKIVPFDDPDKNIELLNLGRKKCPRIVDAYDRVKHYYCQLSEDKTLLPMKYLLPAGTEDLLYGIVSVERTEGNEDSEEEFDHPILDSECDLYENADEDKKDGAENSKDDDAEHSTEDNVENSKEDDVEGIKEDEQPEEKTIYDKISDEEKTKLSEKIKSLLEIIQSENCFNYLKQLVEGPEENLRMKLLKENEEAKLLYRSGLGPFFVAERSQTDQLSETLEAYAKKLDFRGDVSLLERHVLQPEAIVFALQTLCKWDREPAETFFLRWTYQIPEWIET